MPRDPTGLVPRGEGDGRLKALKRNVNTSYGPTELVSVVNEIAKLHSHLSQPSHSPTGQAGWGLNIVKGRRISQPSYSPTERAGWGLKAEEGIMSFKLARHFAERAAEAAPLAAGSTSPFAAGAFSPTAFDTAAVGIAFSELPGFARAPIAAASAAPDESADEQVRIQRDTYALMSGAGINVVVKNSEQQSRFG